MNEITGIKVVDVVKGKVKDQKGKHAPQEVVDALQEAGVVSFNCQETNWDSIKAYAQSLSEQLRVPAQPS